MQEAGAKFGGPVNRTISDCQFSFSKSFELREKAKAAITSGDVARGSELLGQSLQSSVNFEQRVVVQQYWDKPRNLGNPIFETTKTMDEAVNGLQSIGKAHGFSTTS